MALGLLTFFFGWKTEMPACRFEDTDSENSEKKLRATIARMNSDVIQNVEKIILAEFDICHGSIISGIYPPAEELTEK